MDFLSTNSWIIIGVIIAVGVVLAPIIQTVWVLRFLMASYVALCLVFLLPDQLIFNVYAKSIFFGAFLIIFTLVEKGRFFDVSEWIAGRFSVQVFVLSVMTVFFLCTILCQLLPFALIAPFITKEVHDLLVGYMFYIAIAPLIFAILFGKRL